MYIIVSSILASIVASVTAFIKWLFMICFMIPGIPCIAISSYISSAISKFEV